ITAWLTRIGVHGIDGHIIHGLYDTYKIHLDPGNGFFAGSNERDEYWKWERSDRGWGHEKMGTGAQHNR
ncbi:hypothetical protein ACJX0J_009955, partial [Zea mays]